MAKLLTELRTPDSRGPCPQANSAVQDGGAIGTQSWAGALLAITGTTLSSNTAAQGGALQCNAGTELSIQARS